MRAGDVLDDFRLSDQHGKERSLSELLEGGPIVLFFYPAAMTYGCTKESCHFRDLAPQFAELGAQRIGISSDTVAKQKEFADTNTFDFILLSDADFALSEKMGVRRALLKNWGRRMTFLINTDRSIIRVIHTEISMEGHADKAIKILKKWQAKNQN